ncbi:MAG: creatininase family protein [Gemmatimonadetes bacterium]|nr:creatininase family protein [Gemmatimonadota bacterium]
MKHTIDYTRAVQYERMLGRQATDAIAAFPVGYLPIGCLERHGDHLPMGLDIIKAHQICCLVAQTVGGVVFPPHYYGGIHNFNPEQAEKYTGEWGNIYTDRTAKDHLTDIIDQLAIAGIRVLVLYAGHYPECQVEMIRGIAADFADHPSITVIPFCESMIMKGDHAGISETSFMLYLDKNLVDMTRIGEANYRDHGWQDETAPEKGSSAKGEEDADLIITHLKREIEAVLSEQ